jgi:2-amino-4-hydroxy-6-hydroxymethyldihydropteridine diphosphokinase
MNRALIMLASNANADSNMVLAKNKLAEHFKIINESKVLITKPHGEQYRSDFQNNALKIFSNKTAVDTKAIFKQIEREMGRTSESKQLGIIPIDIDLIFWNETLIHKDYCRFEFVKKCIDEIK